MFERLKARCTKDLCEIPVDQAGVGDGGFALQGFELLLFGTVPGGLDLIGESLVDKLRWRRSR